MSGRACPRPNGFIRADDVLFGENNVTDKILINGVCPSFHDNHESKCDVLSVHNMSVSWSVL